MTCSRTPAAMGTTAALVAVVLNAVVLFSSLAAQAASSDRGDDAGGSDARSSDSGHGLTASVQGMVPGVPGICGCKDLPLDYPDYEISYATYDSETGTWNEQTRTVSHRTVETEHFAIHYPDSTSRRPPKEGSGGTERTNCRWDWGIEEVKDFGEDGFQVDCLAEETFAIALGPILETVWQTEIGMGYPEPDMPGGKIDVYVGDLEALLDIQAVAAAEPCSESTGGSTSSRLFVDSTLGQGEELEAALAHELFHVIQNGLDHKEGLAWSEATALWMQGMVTGSIPWGYVEEGLQNADRALTDVADPWDIRYAQVVWPEFLARHYGPEIIRDIWLEAGAEPGDQGMEPAYEVLNQAIDGYSAAIHQFRYDLWAVQGAPVSASYALSPTSSQMVEEFEVKETAAWYIELRGDPSRSDGTLKLCVENLDDRAGLWTRVAYQESVALTPPGGSKQVRPSDRGGALSLEAEKSAPRAWSEGDTSWCEGARALGSAPAGYVLPFAGFMYITYGPGEGDHTGSSSQAIDYANGAGDNWAVLAPAPGTVLDVTEIRDNNGDMVGFGRLLRIRHHDGLVSLYGHLNSVAVEAGDTVSAGQVVAHAGTEGNSTGIHLHFEVRSGATDDNIYSGSSVDIRGLPGTWWCEWYPPGESEKFSGYADPSTAGGIDDSAMVPGGESPPDDGTAFDPGDTFTKSWTLSNSGTSTWIPGDYYATRVSGDFGPSTLPLDGEVAPGETAVLTGDFEVPDAEGVLRVTYQMTGPNGLFGVQFWVEIVVGDGVDDARFVTESEPHDDTVFGPGQTFTKSWTLQNIGTTTWDPYGYRVANTTNLFGPALLRLGGEVAPGAQVEVQGNFLVPTEPGTYQDVYQMEGPEGLFGEQFWVRIVVSESGVDDARLVSETAPDPGTQYSAGDTFTKQWTLENTGTSVWTTGYYRATRTSGTFGPAYFLLPEEVTPGEQVSLGGEFTVPTIPGYYESTYQMQGMAGLFGDVFSVTIEVLGSVPGDPSSPVYEVSLDMSDPDCPGGYLEIDGFGGVVPWVVLVASYAGDPGTGDLCQGHGPDPVCGHTQTDPACGTARFRVTATMDYPDESEPVCSYQTAARGQVPPNWPVLLGLVLGSAVWIRRRVRTITLAPDGAGDFPEN